MILRQERNFRIRQSLKTGAFCDRGYSQLALESHSNILLFQISEPYLLGRGLGKPRLFTEEARCFEA